MSRQARQRDSRRAEPAGRRVQAQGRRLPDGAGQQGLRALPLVDEGEGRLEHQDDRDKRRARPRPEHRDHGPHRRGQDHDDRADPLLHGPHPQDGRGPRGRRDDGLDGPGAGARHHDHVGCDDGVLARPSDQHHRYARARGLHRRGRAQPARPRRRRRRLRRGRGRPAAVRDRLAPGRQVQGSAHRVHQQDGPHRRELLRLRAVDARPARRQPGADPDPDRRTRSNFAASSTSSRCRRSSTRTTSARSSRRPTFPPSSPSRRTSTTTSSIDAISHFDDEVLEAYLEDEALGHAGDDPARRPRRDARRRDHAGAARLRVQEQGRAAAARRGHRLPAEPARRAADASASTRRPSTEVDARAVDRRAVLGARLQGDVRPVRRQAHVLPRLLRASSRPATASSTRPPARPSGSAASSRCTRTTARSATRSWRARSPPASASRTRRRATRSPPRTRRSCSSR